ncbi:MAG: MalY/PatB family protein [Pseudomonadota bacterium]
MDFDTLIDRRGSYCSKWDAMEQAYGVSPDDGLAMWVADTDFRPPQCVRDALAAYVEHGVFGYRQVEDDYFASIAWWMEHRHGWSIEPDWITTTYGLGNGIGMAINAYSKPGDRVVIFTPVYHEFARKIKAAERRVAEMPLKLVDGRYELDFDRYKTQMTGEETMMIFCSPHNPGGRVWSKAELQAVVAFAKRHDLILVSDEIHHDLVYSGHTHIPIATLPGVEEFLITTTAPSKTFNTAGLRCGQIIIENADLRDRYRRLRTGLDIKENPMGIVMTTACYSAEGAAWTDELVSYLDQNRQVFDEGIAEIPGLRSIKLDGTFLAWVDFSGTGMSREDFTGRVEGVAKIAANHGDTFGTGGENFLRFNLGMPKARIEDAVERLQTAFRDLQ